MSANETSDEEQQRYIDAQWPGFTVVCKCGSKLVKLSNSLGYSDMSGQWGSIDFDCLDCGYHTEIYG